MGKINYKHIGVVGGSQGMGSWLVQFLSAAGQRVSFTSGDQQSQYPTNVALTKEADVIILAVPISQMEPVLKEIFPYLGGKLLIDVCSVKNGISACFNKLMSSQPNGYCRYFPMHPMFAPSARNIKGQVVIFNDSKGLSTDETAWWNDLFTRRGAVIQYISCTEHDELMGLIQGLNHFNVFVSAKTLADMGQNLDFIKTLSSPSYRIFVLFYTRYVLQNPRLYAEIQIYNPYVKEVTRRFMREAEQLLSIIEQKDLSGFERYVGEIQPFFRNNQQDSVLSDKLIEALGQLLPDTPASFGSFSPASPPPSDAC